MSRYGDSTGLFGAGVGSSTCGEFTCGLCKTVYNQNCCSEEDGGDYVRTERFAGVEVCEECFERIERSVLHRLGDILPWVAKILEEKQSELAKLTKWLRKAETLEVGRAVEFEDVPA